MLFWLECRRELHFRVSASRWDFPTLRRCWRMPAANTRRASASSSSAWITSRSPEHGVAAIRKFSVASAADCVIPGHLPPPSECGAASTAASRSQLRVLEAAIAAGAKAVDLEIESAEGCRPRLEGLRSRAYLLLSYHNYGGTPPVDALLRRMQRVPADGYKIVTKVREEAFRQLQSAWSSRAPIRRWTPYCWPWVRPVSLRAFCRPGSAGSIPTRRPMRRPEPPTGQVSASQLRNLYRGRRRFRAMPKFSE